MGGRSRRWAAKLDMYKKVPIDLLEGSKQGSLISWGAIVIILLLFYKETADYFTTTLTSDLALDTSRSGNDKVKVEFNITMLDLKCDYVEVDVVSVLGNNQNVTKYVRKIPVDANGIRNIFAERNLDQRDIQELALHDESVTQSIEELHESGEEAISLDEKTLEFALNENDLVFVDFFASWCSHCKKLAPTWEVLAKVMHDVSDQNVEEGRGDYNEDELKQAEKLDFPVMIAKVDCVAHKELCVSEDIHAYPTLRLFVEGEHWDKGDYRGQRTIMDMVRFLSLAEDELDKEGKLSMETVQSAMKKRLNVSLEEKHWVESLDRTRRHHTASSWNPDDHPGCQIWGSLLINRVPGNFFVQAFSPYHDLVPHMTNVSHEIHSLSFEPTHHEEIQTGVLPPNFLESTRPMDGNVYVTQRLHEAYHHYIKLITTNGNAYQILQSSQLATYRGDQVPEAKFILDLSPIAIRYRRVSRHWYDYSTSVFAIIGGTFTVVGFLETIVRRVSRRVLKQSGRRQMY